MIPPTTTGTSTPSSAAAATTSGTSSRCEPERIERPTTSTSSCDRRGGDLLGRQADPLVDDLHADVAGAQGDLLGAVRVAVEAGLADQDLDPVAELLGDLVDPLAGLGQQLPVAGGRRAADAGRAAVGAEDLAQGLRPLAGRGAGPGGGDRRRHHVLVLVGGDPGQLLEGGP